MSFHRHYTDVVPEIRTDIISSDTRTRSAQSLRECQKALESLQPSHHCRHPRRPRSGSGLVRSWIRSGLVRLGPLGNGPLVDPLGCCHWTAAVRDGVVL